MLLFDARVTSRNTTASKDSEHLQEKPRGGPLGGLFGGAKAEAEAVGEEVEQATGGSFLGGLFGGGGAVYADDEARLSTLSWIYPRFFLLVSAWLFM